MTQVGGQRATADQPRLCHPARPPAATSTDHRDRGVGVRRAARPARADRPVLPLAGRAAWRRLRRHPDRRRRRRRGRRQGRQGGRRHHPGAGSRPRPNIPRCRAARSPPGSPISCCRSRELAERLAELIRDKATHAADAQRAGGRRGACCAASSRICACAPATISPSTSARPCCAGSRAACRSRDATICQDYYDLLRDNADEAQALLGDLLISVTTFFRDRRGVRGADAKCPAAAVRRQGAERRRSASGCRLRHRRGSLYDRHAAARGGRPARIRARRSRCSPPTSTRARWRSRARAAIPPRSRPMSARSGCAASSSARATITGSARSCATSCCSPATACSRTRRSRGIDLISCRNLLIYLDRELQQQVCSTFHYALNPGGFLFLGSSETADNPAGLFARSTARRGSISRRATPATSRGCCRACSAPSGYARAVRRTAAAAPTRRLLSEAAAHRQGAREGGAAEHPGRRGAPGRAPVRERRPLSAALRRAAERRRGRPGAAGAALRAALGAAPRVRAAASRRSSLPIPVRFNGAPHRVLSQVKPASRRRRGQAAQRRW